MKDDKWESVHELAEILGVTLVDETTKLSLAAIAMAEAEKTRKHLVSLSSHPTYDRHHRGDHPPYIRQEKKISRNAPCPCGSGKKYKKCCL